MLYLVKGRAGSGKTNYIRNVINGLTDECNSKPLFIVPEQFSFETERAMLGLLGAQKTKKVDIFSFPRMAISALKNTGLLNLSIPDKGVKSALMSETLKQLEGELQIFSGYRHNANAMDSLVEFCKELKYCCIDSADIQAKLSEMEDCFLKNKLSELDLISSAYDAILSQSYFDDTELVTVFTSYAIETGYFKNKTVFLDGFRGFSKQELECLKVVFSQADNIYITLCVDNNSGKYSSLYYMRELEKKLRTNAAQCSLSVEEINCKQSENAFRSDIFQIEKNLYSNKSITTEKSDGSVSIVCCQNIEDECKFVAASIKKLLRTGEYRCRDIAVIERSNGVYKSAVVKALKDVGIPVFDDSRRPLSGEALTVFVLAALECVAMGFTTERVMRYLKTGFTDISVSQISELEKYVLVWGINGKGWLNDFTMHPDGFGSTPDEKSQKKLEMLNEIRKKAVLPLLKLKKSCEDVDGKAVAKAVYEFIDGSQARKKLFELSQSLETQGFGVEASRQEVSWNAIMQLLDTSATLTEGKFYSLKRWYELFLILVSCSDIGEIPQGLDEVTVGSADRIRTEKMKVAFLVGVNKDEFPLVNVKNGILTDADRVKLIKNGLEFRPPFEETVDEERFIAYCAVTAASEKLYICYKTSDASGESLSPSEIVETALNSIEDVQCINTVQLSADYYIESENDAFTALAVNYSTDNEIRATLLKYFENNEQFYGKLKALDTAVGKKPFNFENSKNATELFGERLHLSASRVESFYNCPFAYFVRYGLGAEPLKTATLDPAQSGTIVHHILEKVLQKHPARELADTDDIILRETVENILREYLNEKMGGFEEKSKRFMFLFERFTDIAMAIISRLKLEFGVGSFEPHDFELRIGGDKVGAYELPLENGSVKLTGYIDRVDLMEKDGEKYVRVIDYKTGKKEFRLCELLDGLNIQMVLYLMALAKNGKDYLGDFIPSGVLYLPSRIGIGNYLEKRSPSPENVAAQKRVSGKLSGMVLDSPVVFNGMGVDKTPDYFPVDYKKDGSPKGNYYNIAQFKTLSKIIDGKIIEMGEALHRGEIDAVPCGSDNVGKMCDYCSYKAVCGREKRGNVNELTKLRHTDVLKRLEDDCDEQTVD